MSQFPDYDLKENCHPEHIIVWDQWSNFWYRTYRTVSFINLTFSSMCVNPHTRLQFTCQSTYTKIHQKSENNFITVPAICLLSNNWACLHYGYIFLTDYINIPNLSDTHLEGKRNLLEIHWNNSKIVIQKRLLKFYGRAHKSTCSWMELQQGVDIGTAVSASSNQCLLSEHLLTFCWWILEPWGGQCIFKILN